MAAARDNRAIRVTARKSRLTPPHKCAKLGAGRKRPGVTVGKFRKGKPYAKLDGGKTYNSQVEFPCVCGGTASAGDCDGQMAVLHTVPHCDRWLNLGPVEYLRECRIALTTPPEAA